MLGRWQRRAGLVILAVVAGGAGLRAAEDRPAGPRSRAKPPQFEAGEVSSVFFDNAFGKLRGTRPSRGAMPAAAGASALAPPAAATADAAPSGTGWGEVISSATLEDEIKALKLELDGVVTTPQNFAGSGHKIARRDFTLLAVLFAVIREYDGTVRWKAEAATARNLFARVAGNTKAGGAIQVFNEAKARKQDLDELIRGSGLATMADPGEDTWSNLADRAPLMQLLEERLEADLKQWTADAGAFQQHLADLQHEAELTAVIGRVLQQADMEDADQEDYQQLAQELVTRGRQIVEAARLENLELAREAVSGISQTCLKCHENYR